MHFSALTDEDKALTKRDELADRGLYDENEIPPGCQRCGGSFGLVRKQRVSENEEVWSGAVCIGGRWVCNDCEEAEFADYSFDLEQALNELQEDDFSARCDEGEF